MQRCADADCQCLFPPDAKFCPRCGRSTRRRHGAVIVLLTVGVLTAILMFVLVAGLRRVPAGAGGPPAPTATRSEKNPLFDYATPHR